MRTAVYIGGELYDAMVKVLGREPTRDDVMRDLRGLYGVIGGYKRSEQKNKNPLAGKCATQVATSKNSELMDKLKSIASGVKSEVIVTKPHISSKWKQWYDYKKQNESGGFLLEQGWVDWGELVGKEPYKSIKKDIESGNFIF